jgi:hypothetical protein
VAWEGTGVQRLVTVHGATSTTHVSREVQSDYKLEGYVDGMRVRGGAQRKLAHGEMEIRQRNVRG